MPDSDLVTRIFQAADFGSPNLLLVFGLFLILGVSAAVIAHGVRWLPSITAFMVIGIIIGPSGATLIDADMLWKSTVIIDVALGLILYKLGVDVQLKHMLRSTQIWRISLLESVATFACVFLLLFVFDVSLLASAVAASIVVSSSPAVLVHVSEEMQAKGPAVYQAKGLVTLNNVFSFFAFSLLLPFALGKAQVSLVDMAVIPVYRAAGAAATGIFVAFVMEKIDRLVDKEDEHYRFALIIGGITITLGLAGMFEFSSLFAALTLGIATRWMETQRQGLSTVEFGSSGDIFFIALFVMAGANLHLEALKHIGVLAALAALARGAAKAVSLRASQKHSTLDAPQTTAVSLMLMPMGALAIGLAQTTQRFSPSLGTEITPIIFAMVAILETLGPFGVQAGIKRAGESPLYRKSVTAQEASE